MEYVWASEYGSHDENSGQRFDAAEDDDEYACQQGPAEDAHHELRGSHRGSNAGRYRSQQVVNRSGGSSHFGNIWQWQFIS
ncbi:hypothetical protein, partial [Pseudonocardia oceani]|uniref:hypothetical protein n=1 Tax=Pseudonocardia oceani TaxID=2792013 RepID=UPI001C49E1DD